MNASTVSNKGFVRRILPPVLWLPLALTGLALFTLVFRAHPAEAAGKDIRVGGRNRHFFSSLDKRTVCYRRTKKIRVGYFVRQGRVKYWRPYPRGGDRRTQKQLRRRLLRCRDFYRRAPTPTPTPVPPGLHLSVTSSRSSCVAPCAIFFDATQTTSSATSDPFESIYYFWNFADERNTNWPVSGKSTNTGSGPLAAHVFMFPGEYVVSVEAKDAAGQTAFQNLPVQILDPEITFAGSNTTCVSRGDTLDFTGCPPGAGHIGTNNLADVQEVIRPGRRILLRRGDEWTISTPLALNEPGPGLVGAFGSGAPPIIRASGDALMLSGRSPKLRDWRISDLDLRGPNDGSNATAISAEGTVKELLLLRLAGQDFKKGIYFSNSIIDYWNSHGFPGQEHNNQIAIVGCMFTHFIGGGGGNGAFISSDRLMMLGNNLSHSEGVEHVVRFPHLNRAVISHNHLAHQAPNKHVVKLHAPGFEGTGMYSGLYTEYVLLSDNEFKGGDLPGTAWVVGIGPADSHTDERVRHVVVERNLFRAGQGSQVQLVLWSVAAAVRNNIFDLSSVPGGAAMYVAKRGIEPPPTNILIAHNTAYTRTGNLRFLSLGPEVTNIAVKNNAAVAAEGRVEMLAEPVEAPWLAGNIATNVPHFASLDPAGAGDFRIIAGSPLAGAGVPGVPVFDDFDFATRPAGSSPDVGAFELHE